MEQEGDLYETMEMKLEVGQQLIVHSPHRTVFLVSNRSGLHIRDQKDGRRGAKVLCVACNVKVHSAGCERPGCPIKERSHVYAR